MLEQNDSHRCRRLRGMLRSFFFCDGVRGSTGLMPDFCLLVVGANMGVQRMTKEHISIACALQVHTRFTPTLGRDSDYRSGCLLVFLEVTRVCLSFVTLPCWGYFPMFGFP